MEKVKEKAKKERKVEEAEDCRIENVSLGKKKVRRVRLLYITLINYASLLFILLVKRRMCTSITIYVCLLYLFNGIP